MRAGAARGSVPIGIRANGPTRLRRSVKPHERGGAAARVCFPPWPPDRSTARKQTHHASGTGRKRTCARSRVYVAGMADVLPSIDLSDRELREVTRYAAACARPALAIFEHARPRDERPRAAIAAADEFAEGAKRSKALRDRAWAAQRAAREAREVGLSAADNAALAAVAAAGAAFLHPLSKATQVKHILGAAAYAARAFELLADGKAVIGAGYLRQTESIAPPIVRDVLKRYPNAPSGGARVGELVRQLDFLLR